MLSVLVAEEDDRGFSFARTCGGRGAGHGEKRNHARVAEAVRAFVSK